VRYELVSGKEYPVYSRKEADELGLSYKHPYEVSEGEYGISSDGEVAVCLKRSETKNGKLSVKYPWGPSFIRSTDSKVISEGRINNYTISGKNNRGKYLINRDEYKKLAYLLAQPKMTKKKAIHMAFGALPYSKRYEITKITKTKGFQSMVKDELDKIIEKYPIGKMDTAKALAAVLDKVMDWDGEQMGKDGDPKVAMTVLDKLMDMNDMKNKGKMTVTQQIEASTVETTLADIQEKKKLFKAKQTEVTDGLQQAEIKTEQQEVQEEEK